MILFYQDPLGFISIDMEIKKITVSNYETRDEWERNHKFGEEPVLICSSGTLDCDEYNSIQVCIKSLLSTKSINESNTELHGFGRCVLDIRCPDMIWRSEWQEHEFRWLKRNHEKCHILNSEWLFKKLRKAGVIKKNQKGNATKKNE